jgi:hypothetical protein
VKSLSQALYRHPAFMPHRLVGAIGVRPLWAQNAILTGFAAAILTLCSFLDHSLTIPYGFGYFQHPGIFGWYLIQLIMPVAIYSTLVAAARAKKHYREIVTDYSGFRFRELVLNPMIQFIGLTTRVSRSFFALLFLIGFVAFAWNTFQNLFPGELAPLDFWDSAHFPYGYFASRVYKFYLDALLLPSLTHIFAGIVWTNVKVVRGFSRKKKLRLSPFSPDECGGFGFLVALTLSPTMWALLISGLALFGVVYTHRGFDISVVAGVLIQGAILVLFYGIPTFVFRSVLVQVKKIARQEVHLQQEAYYQSIVSGSLKGISLRDAHEYLRYFNDISSTIDKIPNWPHLSKTSRVFGISISPAVVSLLITIGSMLKKFYPNLP